MRIGRADDGHRGLEEIGNRSAFPHELRIHADPEILSHFLAAGLLQCGYHDRFGRARQHRAAQHDQVKRILFLQNFANVPANRFDVAQVEFAVAETGRAHAKKRDIRVEHGGFRIRSRVQTAGFVGLGDQVPDPRLDDRAAPRVHGLDLGGTQIHPDEVVPHMGQTGCRHGPDIPQPEHANRTTHANRYPFPKSPARSRGHRPAIGRSMNRKYLCINHIRKCKRLAADLAIPIPHGQKPTPIFPSKPSKS